MRLDYQPKWDKSHYLGKKISGNVLVFVRILKCEDRKGSMFRKSGISREEVNTFLLAIRSQGVKVSSVHNEWLLDRHNLIYINIETVVKPLIFARKVRLALNMVAAR